MERKEFLDILSIMNHMAHADGQMHPAEKKVLIAVFKAAKVTGEEQELIRGRSSLEEMIQEIKTDDAKTGLVDMMALVAGADGVFEDEEKLLIKKVMKRVGIKPEDHGSGVPRHVLCPSDRKAKRQSDSYRNASAP